MVDIWNTCINRYFYVSMLIHLLEKMHFKNDNEVLRLVVDGTIFFILHGPIFFILHGPELAYSTSACFFGCDVLVVLVF